MKKGLVVSTAVLLSVCSLSFAASMQSLTKAQATKTMTDKTITTIPLVTLNDQLLENTFSGYFGKDGKMQGHFANKPDNAPQSDSGKWMVRNDGVVCVTWDTWDNNKPLCVALYQLKNGVIFVNEQNKKFESMALIDNIKSGNQLG